ncbi:DUF2892 domain-containing protein [Nitrosovibrio tenuis]|uniref:DUF2892 domain-containing protein n=1 Tax=Nitrosovibrio tenuis TaxID=1233 RepID=A0A1H7IH60_9PROT|nr:DUF2892 domain-containing protein [Nitrosovibrio tenuis]SEK61809.1 Protein of unknown function [Nitrosovibrio tenuis]
MNSPNRADATISAADRVRRSTPSHSNVEIDRQTDRNIRRYIGASREAILARIHQLDKEWDIERVIEVNASSLALTGLVLGLTVDKRWFALSGTVLSFLLQHGLQGWCPPVPILRRLGFRTRREIDREKYALKAYLT